MSRDINYDHHYRRPPANNGTSSMSTEQRSSPFVDGSGLSKDMVKKINDVDQGTSTLTSSGMQGFSARIIEKKLFPQTNQDRRASYNLLTIEIIKKPGQTLGLYLREGNGDDRSDGVFVSRMADDGELQKCDVLQKGDEILTVNHVDIGATCLDDVVIMMSITKRLLVQVVRKECKEKSLKTSPVVMTKEKQVNDVKNDTKCVRNETNGVRNETNGANLSCTENLHNVQRRKQFLRSNATDLDSTKFLLRNNRHRVPDGWRSSAPIIVEQKNFQVLEYYPSSFPSSPAFRQIHSRGANNNNRHYSTEILSASAETVRNLKQSSSSTSFNFLTKSNSLPKQNVPLVRTNRWKRSFDVDKNEMNYYSGSAGESPHFALHRYPREIYPDDLYPTDDYANSPHFSAKYSHHPLGPSPKNSMNSLRQNFDFFETDKKSHSIIPSLTGVLVLHVIEGRGMHITCDNVTDNANEEMYCVVQIDGDHRARTEVSNRISGFRWNEVFEIDVCDCKQADFYIYSWHPLHRRTLRHRGRLRLPEALITGRLKDHEHCFALCLEPKGQLLIRVGYQSALYAYRRLSSNKRNAYWGVSLSSLIFRENDAGYGSPILLKRMVDEVERRGIDVLPGLYSMCASLDKKLTLKHQLEIQPSLANLDSESVPDPNLITTLIKDFLRELPEPLVPSCTYQLLVDAWRVLLPNNKDGNAKLMLEVLDCLPIEHKNAFIVLMDHLKYVISHAPNNGMSIEKLSRIFGPLMFCTCRPVETNNLKRIPINYLDYNLAGFVFEVMMDLWPNNVNSDNGGAPWSAHGGGDLESYC